MSNLWIRVIMGKRGLCDWQAALQSKFRVIGHSMCTSQWILFKPLMVIITIDHSCSIPLLMVLTKLKSQEVRMKVTYCRHVFRSSLQIPSSNLDPYELCIVLCDQLCSSGWLGWRKPKQRTFEQTFQIDSFIPAMIITIHWPLPFYTTCSDHNLGWGSQGQKEAKVILVSFSGTLQNDQDEIWFGVEAVQVDHPHYGERVGGIRPREVTGVVLTASQKLVNFGLHLYV